MKYILKHNKYLLVFVTICTIFLSSGLLKVVIDYDFDSFFSKSDNTYKKYKDWQNTFNTNQNSIISIAIERENGIYNREFLVRTDSIFKQIAKVEGIDNALYFTNLSDKRRLLTQIKEQKLVKFNSYGEIKETIILSKSKDWLFKNFVSEDKNSVAGYFYLNPKLFSSPKRDTVCNRIEDILINSKLKYHIYGIPYVRTEFSKKIVNDFLIFSALSVVLLIVVLLIIFRNFFLMIAPAFAVILGVVWTFGIMGWLGHSVNMITNMLIPIIFVVGISDSIHIISAYIECLEKEKNKFVAMSTTLKEVGFATFLTAIVSATGFLSLAITDVKAMKMFGIYGFMGILLTFIISIIIVPNFLLLFDVEKLKVKKSLIGSNKWVTFFDNIYVLGVNHRRKITVSIIFIITISIFFITKIPTSMYFIDDISEKDKLKQSLIFFEEKYSGFKPFEMVIKSKKNINITDQKVLGDIEKIERFLIKKGIFSDFLSVNSILKYSNYVYRLNRKEFYTLPDKQEDIDLLYNLYNSEIANKYVVVDSMNRTALISAKMIDIGSTKTNELELELLQFTKNNLQNIDIEFTGFGYILDKSNDKLRRDTLIGLIIDLTVISLIMSFLFKSTRYIIVSILPNIVPLIVTAGIMGMLNITLTPTSAIVFVIIFGISIDDTIHFLTHYLLLKRKVDKPIKRTLETTGKAMLIVSIILIAGLGTLALSNFGAIRSIGLFGIITIVVAILSEFFITPIIIRAVDNEN